MDLKNVEYLRFPGDHLEYSFNCDLILSLGYAQSNALSTLDSTEFSTSLASQIDI